VSVWIEYRNDIGRLSIRRRDPSGACKAGVDDTMTIVSNAAVCVDPLLIALLIESNGPIN